jgi:beta-lactamase superfamily II metal-dependent hydrolase
VSQAFLDAARPEVVVISVGSENGYGHPSVEALHTYPRYAREVYRTDLNGQITILGSEDGTYEARLGDGAVAHRASGSGSSAWQATHGN